MRIGSEVLGLRAARQATGIQRLMRETHEILIDLLAVENIELVPVNSTDRAAPRNYESDLYLASDPILSKPDNRVSEIDALLFLDLNLNVDFVEIFRERKQRDLPTFFLVHDMIPLTHPEFFLDGSKIPFRLFLQKVLQVTDHIIVTTEKVKSDVLSLGWKIRGEIHVIPLGTSFQQSAPRSFSADRISVLYVSTVEPRKGHLRLIDAYDILRAQGHDIDLNIVGHEGWMCADIVERIRTHPDYPHRLRWHRGVGDHELQAIAHQCNIGVYPSTDEGFGLFVEEGISLGLKVVASDIPVFRERAQPNLSFAELNSQSLAQAILVANRTPFDYLGGRVRTMQDFAGELATLILGKVRT